MQNALSIDVEDWYHDASRASGPALQSEIEAVGSRVERNLETVLDILERHQTCVTLFFLADVAREFPALVRGAMSRGHEIACHGLEHRPAGDRSPAEFSRDVIAAREILEDITGIPVRGFRAPYFLKPAELWALDVLAESGFQYDSSYMPLQYFPGEIPRLSDDGGPVRLDNGLWEFPLPLSALPTGHVLPSAAGGFALRALPFTVMRGALRNFNQRVGPTVVYTHPWEFDPGSPKLSGTPLYIRFFNGIGRRNMPAKLERLLQNFRFGPIREVFSSQLGT